MVIEMNLATTCLKILTHASGNFTGLGTVIQSYLAYNILMLNASDWDVWYGYKILTPWCTLISLLRQVLLVGIAVQL